MARFESSIAAKGMFPKLSVILTAVIAACVAVLSASIGLVGTGNTVKQSTVPDIGHLLMQQAIMDAPEWQHFQALASTRRADELLRLRDLAAAPAAVEAAEQSDVALVAPPVAAEPTDDVATKAAGLQTDQAPSAAAPASFASTSTAEPSTPRDAPVATIVASLDDSAGDTTGAIAPAKPARVAMPRPNPKARPEARKKKLAAPAGGHKQVARLDAGATAAVTAAEKPAVGSSRRGITVAEPRKKKRHAKRAPRQVPPEAITGFPIDVQQTNGQSTSANARFGAGFEGGR